MSPEAAGDLLSIELRHRLRRVDLDVRLSVRRGETLALVGPSGAGKTSVLRAIAGLLKPDHGRITYGDRVLVDRERRVSLPPEDRAVGMMFQDGALFPHLTLAGNVAYGLRPRPAGRSDRRARVAELLQRFGIGDLGGARPAQVSGGERQRAALARAVATSPSILLLDEPLTALDSVTKAHVSGELAHWLAELQLPTVLVSHDYGDVVGLADRIAVIDRGTVIQTGVTADLMRKPASDFVATFAGVNFFVGTASRRGDRTEVRCASGAIFRCPEAAAGEVGLVVDPWVVRLTAGTQEIPAAGVDSLAGPVAQTARQGSRVRVTVGSDPAIVAELSASQVEDLSLVTGMPVTAAWDIAATRLVPLSDDRDVTGSR